LVYIADSSLLVGVIPNSYGGGFWGFISDTPFTSVQLIGGSGTNQQNYTLDNMVYSHGTTVSVPGGRSEMPSIDVKAYPNPFNPRTTISYELPEVALVKIRVYNARGGLVRTLLDLNQTAGHHEVVFDGTGIASGVYFYHLEAGNYSEARKLMLLK
jgi:hypothetical protein